MQIKVKRKTKEENKFKIQKNVNRKIDLVCLTMFKWTLFRLFKIQ